MNVQSKDFKVRCSGIGQIMTTAKGKSPMQIYEETVQQIEKDRFDLDALKKKDGPRGDLLRSRIVVNEKELPVLKERKDDLHLSQTAMQYVKDWLIMQMFKKSKLVTSKHMQKGNIMEDHAIDMVSNSLQITYRKNEVSAADDYKKGTCDILDRGNNLIIDTKVSWDIYTFPLFEEVTPEEDYVWQGMGYMDLYDIDQYSVAYVLTDTPKNLIDKECNAYCRATGYDFMDVIDDFVERMTYENVPEEMKVKFFNFERDDSRLADIQKRVEECRQFADLLIKRL